MTKILITKKYHMIFQMKILKIKKIQKIKSYEYKNQQNWKLV